MDPLTELEAKLAYMENLLEKLNEVVVEQADEIALMKKEIGFLREKISNVEKGDTNPDDGPPPHY